MLTHLHLNELFEPHRFSTSSTSGFQHLNQYNSFPGFQLMFTPQSTVPSSTPSLSSFNAPLSQYSPLSVTGSVGAMPQVSGNSQVCCFSGFKTNTHALCCVGTGTGLKQIWCDAEWGPKFSVGCMKFYYIS